MTLRSTRLCLLALLPALATGAKLRAQAAQSPASKVEHLLVDINETVKKASRDADLVFATLTNYDQQLESSLKHEISALDQTLVKLSNMREKFDTDINKTTAELQHLGAAVSGSEQMASKYEASNTKADKKFGSLLESVNTLVSLLQNAGVTSQGTLVTEEALNAHGEPVRVFTAIRRVLAASQQLRPKFGDVFTAFSPPSLAQLRGQKAATAPPPVKMTAALLKRTVSALTAVKVQLHGQEAAALTQLDSQWQKLESDAAAKKATAYAKKSFQAVDERKADELSFSLKFTKAVLKMDRDFAEVVNHGAASKHNLVVQMADSRSKEQKTLRNLIELLDGENSVPSSLSFLQIKAPQVGFAQLRTEAETAIKNKQDTHEVLMRIKSMLDDNKAVDAASVQNVVKEMGDVLHSVEGEQSRADEAKRRCESQKFHAGEEVRELKANMLMMTSDHTHTEEAVSAAKSNLKGIAVKAKALSKSSKDFDRITAEALKTLESQNKDRATIMSAVARAGEVEGNTDGAPVLALLQELQQELHAQDSAVHEYEKKQSAFKTQFQQYVTNTFSC